MPRTFVLIAVVLLSVVASCTKPNPAYCEADGDCQNGQACDPSTHACVNVSDTDAGTACTANEQCPAATPVCGTDNACRVCALDDECSSGVCAADGSCELAEHILYVAPNGVSAGQCAASAPCEIFYARSVVNEDRFSIRLENGTYSMTSDFTVSGAISKLLIVGGRSAAVQRSISGPAFEVQGASKLTLRGFTLNKGVRCLNGTLNVTRVSFDNAPPEVRPWIDAPSCTLDVSSSELYDSTGVGILADGVLSVTDTRIEGSASHGIRVQTSNSATIRRSTVARNQGVGISAQGARLAVDACTVSENLGGGISSTFGSFDITNNAVVRNGNPGASGFGGLQLDSMEAVNRVQHNTIIRNDCDVNYTPTLAGGIYCKGADASNNIIANNFRGNTSLPNAQTGGTCNFGNSLVSETDSTLGFASDGIHLLPSSSAVNAGTAGSVSKDIDGDPRSDGMPDLGADELRP